ncbi:MAG: NAD(P)H-hydrate dehydratase, partial [Dysgonamonadaceae bacterium]|nr:NAD(P)H-hydrate dehydratase [Dysgonamonadaceae bacterium]
IASHELMEMAATAFFDYFAHRYNVKENSVALFCGTGNNGGDGVAVARLLHDVGYRVKVFLIEISSNYADDCALNIDRAQKKGVDITRVTSVNQTPDLGDVNVIIDAIFGTGLSRELNGLAKDVIERINKAQKTVVAIDVPSGLFMDKRTSLAVKASETVTFQIPKLPLFLPNNHQFVGKLSIVDIGLHTKAIDEAKTNMFYLTDVAMADKLKPLAKYAHKGTQGHALIIGGSLGKIGAISLASRAALKIGCGLVTAYIPQCGVVPLQSYFPEGMVIQDNNYSHISSISYDIEPNAVAIGMGMGKHTETKHALKEFLENVVSTISPIVIDADALNILAENKNWLSLLKPNTILTPHPGELERLIGKWEDDFEKIALTRAFAQKYNVIVIVKGAHTLIVNSTHLHVNSSGTPALSTAGSGDVLSGIIAGLLAQRYQPLVAAQLGVFIHGMTANVTSNEINPRTFIATDIIDNIGKVYNTMVLSE